ncbi:MAG TPA: M15 family metallopeptidase [Candidatus Omnitrophota bacterium]|nr:M15 family metallopeptidase [Candidatus Omnitrophota bacterium]
MKRLSAKEFAVLCGPALFAFFLVQRPVWIFAESGGISSTLSAGDIQLADSSLKKLSPLIETKKTDGTLAVMTFEELFSPLDEREKAFFEKIQSLQPGAFGVRTPYLGTESDFSGLVPLEKQPILRQEGITCLDTQYLPAEVYEAYARMMEAMRKDLGKILYVESGFRSPAYQLYLFVFYLPRHGYSLEDTAKWNALPGYSEHGCFARQALDLINEEGVNGDESVESFELLPEYQWLIRHASEYGFYLSYPKGNPAGINFEPWHWHYGKTGSV